MQITPTSPHVGVEIAGVTGAAAFDAREIDNSGQDGTEALRATSPRLLHRTTLVGKEAVA